MLPPRIGHLPGWYQYSTTGWQGQSPIFISVPVKLRAGCSRPSPCAKPTLRSTLLGSVRGSNVDFGGQLAEVLARLNEAVAAQDCSHSVV